MCALHLSPGFRLQPLAFLTSDSMTRLAPNAPPTALPRIPHRVADTPSCTKCPRIPHEWFNRPPAILPRIPHGVVDTPSCTKRPARCFAPQSLSSNQSPALCQTPRPLLCPAFFIKQSSALHQNNSALEDDSFLPRFPHRIILRLASNAPPAALPRIHQAILRLAPKKLGPGG